MISHGKRWTYAFRAFFSLIVHGRLAGDIVAALAPPHTQHPASPAPATPPETSDRAVQMLALLQRDGRLIDFLMEDLTSYPDAQVGAAVRDVHTNCRASLARYVTLAPVLDRDEGEPTEVDPAMDPARVKVVGNLARTPPFRGVLRHRGWEATRLDLPPLPVSGRTVVAPAEIEVA